MVYAEQAVPVAPSEEILKPNSLPPRNTNPISIVPHFMFSATLMSTPESTVNTENSEKRIVKMKIIEPKGAET